MYWSKCIIKADMDNNLDHLHSGNSVCTYSHWSFKMFYFGVFGTSVEMLILNDCLGSGASSSSNSSFLLMCTLGETDGGSITCVPGASVGKPD